MKGEEKNDKAMSAELLISIPIKERSNKSITFVALFDTGTSKSLIDKELIDKAIFQFKTPMQQSGKRKLAPSRQKKK